MYFYDVLNNSRDRLQCDEKNEHDAGREEVIVY